MKVNALLILVIFLSSCTSKWTVGTKDHYFGETPQKVLWIQIPGLDEQHLSLLKFSKENSRPLSFERSTCFGKAWSYNLYDIRPSAYMGLNAQIFGSKNITNQCESYNKESAWDVFEKAGHYTGILEYPVKANNSLHSLNECKSNDSLKSTRLWTIQYNEKSEEKFHELDQKQFEKGNTYFSKSCNKTDCYTDLISNVMGIFQHNFDSKRNFFFLVRDFRLYDSLGKGKIKSITKLLLEYEKLYSLLQDIQRSQHEDMLVVFSSTASIPIELPKSGKDWYSIEGLEKSILYKRQSLLSPAFAFGPRSENFCGVFEESEMYQRVLKVYGATKFNRYLPAFPF